MLERRLKFVEQEKTIFSWINADSNHVSSKVEKIIKINQKTHRLIRPNRDCLSIQLAPCFMDFPREHLDSFVSWWIAQWHVMMVNTFSLELNLNFHDVSSEHGELWNGNFLPAANMNYISTAQGMTKVQIHLSHSHLTRRLKHVKLDIKGTRWVRVHSTMKFRFGHVPWCGAIRVLYPHPRDEIKIPWWIYGSSIDLFGIELFESIFLAWKNFKWTLKVCT